MPTSTAGPRRDGGEGGDQPDVQPAGAAGATARQPAGSQPAGVAVEGEHALGGGDVGDGAPACRASAAAATSAACSGVSGGDSRVLASPGRGSLAMHRSPCAPRSRVPAGARHRRAAPRSCRAPPARVPRTVPVTFDRPARGAVGDVDADDRPAGVARPARTVSTG